MADIVLDTAQALRYQLLLKYGERTSFDALDNMVNFILNGDKPQPVVIADGGQVVEAKPLEAEIVVTPDTGSSNR